MKKLLSIACAAVCSTSMFAQTGAASGTRYGIGQDSVRCIENISLYVPYAKSGNYKEALEFWKIAYTECPAANRDLYFWGSKIVAWQMENEKDPAKKKEYFNKLMSVYDQRIKYFGDDRNFPEGYVLGLKAVDYIQYSDPSDTQKKPAYEMLEKSLELQQGKTQSHVIQYFMMLSNEILKANPAHKEKFIQDYLKASAVADLMIAENNPKTVETDKQAKAQIDLIFANSSAADCKTLEGIYGPLVEKNKTDLNWLKDAISIFRRIRCDESEVYFTMSGYAHKIEPTAESAKGCAQQELKKKNTAGAITYLEEAFKLEQDKDQKADIAFKIAQIVSESNKVEARNWANRALEQKPNFGEVYIFIAQLYAQSARSIYGNDPVMSGAVFYLAVDKLEKAKQVDPSSAKAANELIATYRRYYPKDEEIFMHNELKKGAPIRIGGWINETTICR